MKSKSTELHLESQSNAKIGAKTQGQAKDKNEKIADLEKKAFALEQTKIELQISRMSVKLDLVDAENAVKNADLRLQKAMRELQHFKASTLPRKLNRSVLKLDRSKHRHELAKDELGELEKMYSTDDFAASTKELVLKRGRKSLEFARRELAFAASEHQDLEEIDLPREQIELEQSLEKARRTVAKARLSLQITKLRNTKKTAKAERAVREATSATKKIQVVNP